MNNPQSELEFITANAQLIQFTTEHAIWREKNVRKDMLLNLFIRMKLTINNNDIKIN